MNSTEDKKMLIESMKRLVNHVSNNPQRQQEIFEALSLNDLNKIIHNLKDDNEYLRRISALLLCQLFYQNKRTKRGAANLLCIHPNQGRICLGGIPQAIQKYPSTLKKCLQLLQSVPTAQEEDKMCWVINLERKVLKIQYMDYKKYSSFTFIDPIKYVFGFTIIGTQNKISSKTPETVKQTQIAQSKKSQPQQPIRVVLQSPKVSLKEHYQPSSQFYKNFLQNRHKSKQKRMSTGNNTPSVHVPQLQLKEENRNIGLNRPLTSKGAMSYGIKKTFENSYQFRPGSSTGIQSGSQTPRNTYNKPIMTQGNTLNTSTFEYTYKNSTGESTFLKNIKDSPNRDLKTDRKYSAKDPRVSTTPTDSMASTNKHTRMSFGNRQMSTEHEKFYKRVKDILRK